VQPERFGANVCNATFLYFLAIIEIRLATQERETLEVGIDNKESAILLLQIKYRVDVRSPYRIPRIFIG
jgi:hypothetical protein